jgi:hypothetical protein
LLPFYGTHPARPADFGQTPRLPPQLPETGKRCSIRVFRVFERVRNWISPADLCSGVFARANVENGARRAALFG